MEKWKNIPEWQSERTSPILPFVPNFFLFCPIFPLFMPSFSLFNPFFCKFSHIKEALAFSHWLCHCCKMVFEDCSLCYQLAITPTELITWWWDMSFGVFRHHKDWYCKCYFCNFNYFTQAHLHSTDSHDYISKYCFCIVYYFPIYKLRNLQENIAVIHLTLIFFFYIPHKYFACYDAVEAYLIRITTIG